MHKEAVYIYGVAKGANFPLTMKAITLTTERHKGQTRADGVTPYSEHPIEVCRTLLNHGFLKLKLAQLFEEDRHIKDVTCAAALDHDLEEDGGMTHEEIIKEFGDEVAYLVDLVTKKKGMTFEEHIKNVSQDIRAVIIKAADRTRNISQMAKLKEAFPTERLEKVLKETKEYVLPMMKKARRIHLEYSDMLVAFRDHIKAVMEAVEEVIKERKENERLKKENEQFKNELVKFQK